MGSALDRDNEFDPPSAGTSPTGSCDPPGLLDIRGGVRRAHGFQLTDDNILHAVDSTMAIANNVLIAATQAVDASKPVHRPAVPADEPRSDAPIEPAHFALIVSDETASPDGTPHRSPLWRLAGWGLALSASAMVTVLITGYTFSDLQRTLGGGPSASAITAGTPLLEPRLVIAAVEPGTGDNPLPLGMSVDHPEGAAGVLIGGLPEGADLSVGNSSGPNQWYVPAAELEEALAHPLGFAGTMDLSVELQRADGRAVERRSIRLTWSNPREPSPPAIAAAHPRPAEATAFVVRKLEPDEIATLLRRGEDFFANGDVAAARLMLLRAAEAGDARAALGLAATYDPIALGDGGIRGAFADPDMARTWYERAKAFGSPDAPRRLEMLASRTH
jgi:hypothetical protein